MTLRSVIAVFAPLLLSILLGGCGDERDEAHNRAQAPWPEEGAPDALRALADDLLAYQRVNRRMPTALADLDSSGVSTGGPYAAKGYAYHASGIGVLRDGWRVVAADDRVREQDRVWCVLRPAVRINGLPGLRVALVPITELRQAASAAGGGT